MRCLLGGWPVQAIVHHLVILTPDDLVNQYPVRTMW